MLKYASNVSKTIINYLVDLLVLKPISTLTLGVLLLKTIPR